MTWYVDSSVAAHVLLPRGNPAAEAWFDDAAAPGFVYSSVLLEIELIRTLRRENLPVAWVSEVVDRVTSLRLSDGVLRGAAAIEPHIRTLDAIHLATCDLLGPDAVLVSHDARMLAVAREARPGDARPACVTGPHAGISPTHARTSRRS